MNTLTIQADALANALRHGVAAARSPHPMLQHVRLRTVLGGMVAVETTDTEVWVQSRIPAQADSDFDLLLRDELLRPVAAAGGELVIHPDGKIRGTHGRYTVPAMPSDDFPDADGGDAWVQAAVDAAELREALRAVSYTAEDDTPAASFRAAFVVPGTVWATDGLQMAVVAAAYDGPRFAIPTHQVSRVLLALQQDDATVSLANVRGNAAGLLRVAGPDLEVSLRLLPPVPHDMAAFVRTVQRGEQTLEIARGPLLAALRRFVPFIAYKTGRVNGKPAIPVARLAMVDGVLSLSDRTGEFTEQLVDTVREATGGDWSIAFDLKRLQAALAAMDAESITFHPSARNDTRPLVAITPHGSSLDQVAHLLALITE
jgi:hypothetical protein